MTSPLIVFDLDGTLVDTAPDLITSLNHTIATLGLAPVGYEDITHLVGQGAQAMIQRACAMRGHPLDGHDLPPLLQTFIGFYESTMPGQSKPFPGLLPAMDALRRDGFNLAVCTNKLEALANRLLDALNLSQYFDVVTGGDTFTVRKPDPQHLLGTIARAGGDVHRTIMIGDSVNDILAAKNADVASIVVPFGYSDVPIAQLGATRMMTDFEELTPAFAHEVLAAHHHR